MYDLAFPDEQRPYRLRALLDVLAVRVDDVPRLRDGWLEVTPAAPDLTDHASGGDLAEWSQRLRIALYARIGGGNRPAHARAIAQLQAHPRYVGDVDDQFDATYATFRFRATAPARREPPEVLRGLKVHDGQVDTAQRWRDALARIERGDITPGQLAQADQLLAAIAAAHRGEGPAVIRV